MYLLGKLSCTAESVRDIIHKEYVQGHEVYWYDLRL